MTEGVDREELIGLLEKLGSADDAEVVAVAREIDVRMKAANVAWSDLLSPDADADEAEVADADDDVEPGAAADGSPPNDADAARLIDALLASKDLSDDLREELEGYKKDIAEGEFEPMDREYVRSLHRRLTKSA